MYTQLYVIKTMADMYWSRLQTLREDERGMTTETVIITAVLAGLAILVTGVIATAVTRKAGEITVD